MKQNLGYTFRNGASLAKLERILTVLAEPKTRSELCEIIGIGLRSLHPYLNHLMDPENRRVHICGWRRNSPGSPSPLYLVGDLPDKRRPRAVTNAERLAKRRKDPEWAIDQRNIQRLEHMKPRRDKLTAALFGKA